MSVVIQGRVVARRRQPVRHADGRTGRLVMPIARIGDVVGRAEGGGPLAQREHHVSGRERVEAALDSVAVRVEARGEEPVGEPHFPREPADRRLHPPAEEGRSRQGERGRQLLDQEGVVVEHLLEVRDEPDRVGAVAREATADMVVDPAKRHPVQGQGDGPPHRRRVEHQRPQAQQGQHRGVGELGRAVEAAVLRVGGPQQACRHRPDVGRGRAGADPWLRGLREGAGVARDLGGLVRVGARHMAQHGDEGRPAVARLLGKIRAPPERLATRCQEHRHRPPALLTQRVQRAHEQVVDVRPLFAIDLDVDEERVHDGGRRLVLETLPLHHMAPMARRIADREQDRAVVLPRQRERLRSPFVPVDRIVAMLEQVRARGLGETVHAHRVLQATGM